MSLRDLTHEAHKVAERQEFVKILFSGKIDPKLYAKFLWNQHACYEILESCARAQGLLDGITDISRADAILNDYKELWADADGEAELVPVVQQYRNHIMSIKDDAKKLMAHMYVRHMGDLAGGQMIAKKVPGTASMYQFTDPEALKATVRQRISDDMSDEAVVCFEFATQMFKELLGPVELSHE